MKTGVELIAIARGKQLAKGRTIALDVKYNSEAQLISAAHIISHYFLHEINHVIDDETMEHLIEASELMALGWDTNYLKKALKKPYIERLAIAGALIAAEIDRIQNK